MCALPCCNSNLAAIPTWLQFQPGCNSNLAARFQVAEVAGADGFAHLLAQALLWWHQSAEAQAGQQPPEFQALQETLQRCLTHEHLRIAVPEAFERAHELGFPEAKAAQLAGALELSPDQAAAFGLALLQSASGAWASQGA